MSGEPDAVWSPGSELSPEQETSLAGAGSERKCQGV